MIAKLRPPHSCQCLYGYLQHLHSFWDYVYLISLFSVPFRQIWVPNNQGLSFLYPRNCAWLILITTVLYFIYVCVGEGLGNECSHAMAQMLRSENNYWVSFLPPSCRSWWLNSANKTWFLCLLSPLVDPLIKLLNCGMDPEIIELALFQSCIIWGHELLLCLNSKQAAINN